MAEDNGNLRGPAIGKGMDKTREKMKRMLEEKEVSAILALRSNHGHPTPFLFTKTEDLKDWVADETNRYPLTKILIKIAKKHPDEIIGIVVRGCEERSLVELLKNFQLRQGKVKAIVIACSQELANRCRCPRPFPSQVEESELAQPIEDFSDIDEIEKLPEEERFQYWM